jgi:hypothetical protein
MATINLKASLPNHTAHLSATALSADPQAPIDAKNRKRKQYRSLNNCIRTLIYQALKAHNE